MMTHCRRQSESDGESNSDDETDEISFSMWIRENLKKKRRQNGLSKSFTINKNKRKRNEKNIYTGNVCRLMRNFKQCDAIIHVN